MGHLTVTFGSCLSRYVARTYKRLFAGDIAASVYHNRSDHFVRGHLADSRPLREEDLRDLDCAIATSDLHDDARHIVRNQTTDGLGKHKLDNSAGFFAALSNPDLRLVFMDNFMDLSAKESISGDLRCFLRPQDYTNYDERFRLGDFISAAESAKNFHTIIDHVRRCAPQARIVFMHFPFNTYSDEARKARTLAFVEAFNPDKVTVIAPMSVPKVYRTDVASHFHEPQYAAYAGMIHALTTVS